VSRVRTSSDTVDWIKQVTRTNNAATVAEATATTGTSGTKPESAINYERVTQAIETIATWIPITTRALADAPQMQDIINGELLIMLGEELEDQVISGDGTSPNLKGLLNSTILTQATAAGTNNLDTLMKMMTKIEVSGKFGATDIVLNPVNWETLRLLRENSATATLGNYLMGPPSLPGPMTIFGIPVVKSQGLTSGTGLVGNFTPITHTLFDRQQSVVRMGYIDDQFVRNMLTLLGELRAAFAVKRPYAFCSVTGLV
jgi:HK97 family phage major capsid protein